MSGTASPEKSTRRNPAKGIGIGVGIGILVANAVILEKEDARRENLHASSTSLDANSAEFVNRMLGRDIPVRCAVRDKLTSEEDRKQGITTDGRISQFSAGVLPDVKYLSVSWGSEIYIRKNKCHAISNLQTAVENGNQKDIQDHDYVYGSAALTLSHEHQHLEGTMNEAKTECYAYQHLPAELLDAGLNEWAVRTLMRSIRDRYRLYTLDDYVSPECSQGGAYDLGINTDIFPGMWSKPLYRPGGS